jgi:hypothetical protein
MNDVNHLNSHRTQTYLPISSTIIVANTIDRILSGRGAREHITTAKRVAGSSNPVWLVGTKSEVWPIQSGKAQFNPVQEVQHPKKSTFTKSQSRDLEYWTREERDLAHELSQLGPYSNTELIRYALGVLIYLLDLTTRQIQTTRCQFQVRMEKLPHFTRTDFYITERTMC